MSPSTDFYALLGVSPTATEDEMKRAYRKLARELHPDANPGDPAAEERFKEITLAYETLRDPERRRRYDRFGPDAVRGTGAAAGAPGDSFGGFGNSGLGDLFDAFFGGASPFGAAGGGGGGRGARSGPRRGEDAEAVLDLEFAEAVFGAQREITVRLPATCEACSGTGARAGTTPTTCTACGGSGELRRVRQSILGQMVTASPCQHCRGTGEQIASPCPDCRGEGRRLEEKSFVVDVPAGIDEGSTLRLSGRGASGGRGGSPGDLYVHVRVQPDARFVRHGADIHHELHLAVTQAALGAQLRFETLDGDEELMIPAGVQTGRELRLRGRGAAHLQIRGRGDLIITIVVDVPTDLTKAQEDLLRQLADERGEVVAPADNGLLSKIRGAFK